MNDDWPFLLEELYGVRPGDDVGDFDFDNYTYIVTCGHELYKLQYSFGKISGLSACSPQDIHYVGRVFLKYDKADKFYIYRIRRMNISVDNYTGFNDIFFVPPEAEQYN